jgi:hypothetical protein
MMLVLRALARVLELVWMVVVALAGLAVAAYCLDGVIGLGSHRPDRLLRLPSVRVHVGHALRRLGDPGPVAALGLIGGILAILVALALLAGLLAPRRPRLLLVADDPSGRLAARPRTVAAMLRERAGSVAEITRVSRPRLRTGRLVTRARLTVVPSAAAEDDVAAVREQVQAALAGVTEPFSVRVRVSVRVVRRRT